MEEDEMLESETLEEDEVVSEEDEDRVDLDLSLDTLREESVQSVVDVVDIPLFTDRFVMPERTRPITFNDVFTTSEVSRGQTNIVSQDVLFAEPIIIAVPTTATDEESTNTILLVFGFVILGIITMIIMNLYLKKRKKKVEQA